MSPANKKTQREIELEARVAKLEAMFESLSSSTNIRLNNGIIEEHSHQQQRQESPVRDVKLPTSLSLLRNHDQTKENNDNNNNNISFSQKKKNDFRRSKNNNMNNNPYAVLSPSLDDSYENSSSNNNNENEKTLRTRNTAAITVSNPSTNLQTLFMPHHQSQQQQQISSIFKPQAPVNTNNNNNVKSNKSSIMGGGALKPLNLPPLAPNNASSAKSNVIPTPKYQPTIYSNNNNNGADEGAGTPAVAAATTIQRQDSMESNKSFTTTSSLSKVIMASPAMKPVTKVIDYVKDEMRISGVGVHSEGQKEYDSDVAMAEFMTVPFRLEPLMWFSWLVCWDSFLYVSTFLPLKFLWSIMCLIISTVDPRTSIFNPYRKITTSSGVSFNRRHFYHVIQIGVLYLVSSLLMHVSIGRLYHWIRGQAMFKLYLLISIGEIFDRLLVSFGQDAVNSLYWNTNRRPFHPRMFTSILVFFCYAIVHTSILFVHIATLSVAMNSADQALFSILLSGNFAEIKSTVFKKYNKQTLFHPISTGDMIERFKLSLFFTLILVLNLSSQGTADEIETTLRHFTYLGGAVFIAEGFSDWIKHCFITKLNCIKSDIYRDYEKTIAGDITGTETEGMNLDHTHRVVRRIGLAQIPFAAIMIRYLCEAARYSVIFHEISSKDALQLGLALFGILFVVKVCLGVLTLKIASRILLSSKSNSSHHSNSTSHHHIVNGSKGSGGSRSSSPIPSMILSSNITSNTKATSHHFSKNLVVHEKKLQ